MTRTLLTALSLALLLTATAAAAAPAAAEAAAAQEVDIDTAYPQAYHLLRAAHRTPTTAAFAAAAAAFEPIVAAAPAHVPSLYALGDIAIRTGDAPSALGYARRILQLEPDNVHAYKMYAFASPPTPDKVFALNEVLSLGSGPPDPVVLYDLASTFFALGDFDQALRGFRAVYEAAGPDILMAKYSEALVLATLDDYDAAVDALHELLAVDAHHAYALSLLHLIGSRYPDAVDALGVPPFTHRPHKVTDATLARYSGFVPPPGWSPPVRPLPTDASSIDAFAREFVASRTPVVFETASSGGLAAALGWDPDTVAALSPRSIAEALGNATVLVQMSALGESVGSLASFMGSMPASDFITMAESDERPPLMYLNVQQTSSGDVYAPTLRPFKDALPVPPLLAPHSVKTVNCWAGTAAHDGASFNSSLHNDERDNLYVLVRGAKTFRVFPPTASLDVYPLGTMASFNTTSGAVSYAKGNPRRDPLFPHFAAVSNPYAVDTAAFPRAASLSPVDISLAPGQILYLPSSWWHAVTTEPDASRTSLAVNFWFDPAAPADPAPDRAHTDPAHTDL